MQKLVDFSITVIPEYSCRESSEKWNRFPLKTCGNDRKMSDITFQFKFTYPFVVTFQQLVETPTVGKILHKQKNYIFCSNYTIPLLNFVKTPIYSSFFWKFLIILLIF